ncbi:unnamed protein product, partial [Symbiodinium sp. CCMP2456]
VAQLYEDLIAFDMKANRDAGKSRSLLMKAWDLREAYKNLPLHESSLHESYLCVYDPSSQTTQIFGQFVLPFGARSSVHGFCRVSAALWLAGVSMLRLHWYSYFDDFPTIESEHTCPIAQMGVDFLFTLLGLEYNLEDGERLRGRLNFMDGQLFGKLSQHAFRGLTRHVLAGGGKLGSSTRAHLQFLRDRMSKGRPRRVSTALHETMHIFVDACHEPGSTEPAGLGGILLDSSGRYREYYSEMLDESALAAINVRMSGNPIFELECLAILCALHLWHSYLSGKHLVVYTDNNGALGSMIKGHSENLEGDAIVRLVHTILDLSDCIVWFERVCSSSNVADEPSRGVLRPSWGERKRCDPSDVFALAIR